MIADRLTLANFIKDETLFEKKKKKKKKKKTYKGSKGIRKGTGGLDDGWYSGGGPDGSSGGGGMGESLISEIFAGISTGAFTPGVLSTVPNVSTDPDKDPGMTTYPSENPGAAGEEEVEMQVNKVDQARQIFQATFNRPNATRAEIINSFMKDVGVTNSTAVSYYTRFLDEFGVSSDGGDEALGQGTGMGGMGDANTQGSGTETPQEAPPEKPEMEDSADPDRAGIIRTVDNAHLVYKRQSEDGTYEELWVYNLHNSTHDELEIRRDILAGTDIPVKKTKSPDGAQQYYVTTMGNAQMMNIRGLPN